MAASEPIRVKYFCWSYKMTNWLRITTHKTWMVHQTSHCENTYSRTSNATP